MLNKALKHPQRVLEAVPARHLQHQRGRVGNGLLLEELGAARYPPAASVEPVEGRIWVASSAIVQDPCRFQDRIDRVVGQELVLGGEGVDAGRDDGQPVRVKPFPAVGATGKDEVSVSWT
jgi:hypothetical protein